MHSGLVLGYNTDTVNVGAGAGGVKFCSASQWYFL